MTQTFDFPMRTPLSNGNYLPDNFSKNVDVYADTRSFWVKYLTLSTNY